MENVPPLAAATAARIASYAILQKPEHISVELGQASHRIQLVNAWRIPPGSKVLELGCGQGTCTAALAEAVGPEGHVDAVDPGAPDYGAPFTLAQAQAHLSSGPVGARISWHCAEPVRFLAENAGRHWDLVVLAHCIWYLEGPATLGAMLAALRGRATTLLVAEYALAASGMAAVPHVLAAVARGTLEACVEDSSANIRCLLGPAAIRAAAVEAGWTVEKEEVIVPGADLLDGSWEVGTVTSACFLEEVGEHVEDSALRTTLLSAREAVMRAVELLDGERVRTMDVWVARFS